MIEIIRIMRIVLPAWIPALEGFAAFSVINTSFQEADDVATAYTSWAKMQRVTSLVRSYSSRVLAHRVSMHLVFLYFISPWYA